MASKETEYRFLLAGKSGCGKSSTGNTIMGENVFSIRYGFASGTKLPEYRKSTKPKKGLTFRIVDTTGFFDPKMPNDKIAEQIIQALAYLEPGFDALLYVLQIDRFTPEEQQTFMRLKELFDANIVRYVIIIVTKGDELKRKKMTLEQLLEQADEPLKEVMRECGNRVVVFNNEDKSKRDKQVKELLDMVHKVQINNNNEPYRCHVQEVVNTRLQERNTIRVKEKIRREPKLKELFEGMETQAKEAKELADKQHQEAEETMKREKLIEKMIEEKLKEKERHQEEEAGEKLERNTTAQEEREKQEQERKQRADEERKEREKEQRQKEEEDRKKKLEEERQRKEKEAEEKKKMEEMQKQLQQLKIEREVHEKLEAEKRKLEQKMKEKLEAEMQKREKEEMENTKKDIAEGKESHWTMDVAGGLWRGVKGYFGY